MEIKAAKGDLSECEDSTDSTDQGLYDLAGHYGLDVCRTGLQGLVQREAGMSRHVMNMIATEQRKRLGGRRRRGNGADYMKQATVC